VALPAESLYAKMDIPLVLLEAMSLGKPLLVAENTPLSVLTQGGGAVGVPQKSPDAIASIALQMLESDRFREQLGSLAREDFLQHYTAEVMATRYEALYHELL
jgi:glycosyltransferase involved in cell wall biosynthesis